jgi:hypothetical protein
MGPQGGLTLQIHMKRFLRKISVPPLYYQGEDLDSPGVWVSGPGILQAGEGTGGGTDASGCCMVGARGPGRIWQERSNQRRLGEAEPGDRRGDTGAGGELRDGSG